MHKRVFPVLVAVFLLIFSLGVVYDPCVREESNTLLSKVSLDSSSDPAAPSGIPADGVDCHCLCHFIFNPERLLNIGRLDRFKPFAFSLEEITKGTFIVSILRPPIDLPSLMQSS